MGLRISYFLELIAKIGVTWNLVLYLQMTFFPKDKVWIQSESYVKFMWIFLLKPFALIKGTKVNHGYSFFSKTPSQILAIFQIE